MSVDRKDYLFEVSWEICNQLGEVYTAIHSKIPSAARAFGDHYILLGPDLKNNLEFEETDEDFWSAIRENTAIKDLPCRFGRWKIPGEPKAILVSFGKKYDKDQLLFRIWEDYGVDSISGGWDYVERVMFGYACGEVIGTIHNLKVKPRGLKSVAQFHDAVSGAGLLCVKKMVPEVGTVLTLHSTVLGRTLASSGMDIYSEMDHISPQREAGAPASVREAQQRERRRAEGGRALDRQQGARPHGAHRVHDRADDQHTRRRSRGQHGGQAQGRELRRGLGGHAALLQQPRFARREGVGLTGVDHQRAEDAPVGIL